MDETTYDFEFVLKLNELWDDFLAEWPEDRINQPTLVDFFSWLGEMAQRMADDLGSEIDDNLPPTSVGFEAE